MTVPLGVDYFYSYLEKLETKNQQYQNYFRFLALYMDLKVFEVEVKKMNKTKEITSKRESMDNIKATLSVYSNLSIDVQLNYLEKAKMYAINIFDEYLRYDAQFKVCLPDLMLCELYTKFGCQSQKESLVEEPARRGTGAFQTRNSD